MVAFSFFLINNIYLYANLNLDFEPQMLKNPTIYIRIYMPFIEDWVFDWNRLFAVGHARAQGGGCRLCREQLVVRRSTWWARRIRWAGSILRDPQGREPPAPTASRLGPHSTRSR